MPRVVARRKLGGREEPPDPGLSVRLLEALTDLGPPGSEPIIVGSPGAVLGVPGTMVRLGGATPGADFLSQVLRVAKGRVPRDVLGELLRSVRAAFLQSGRFGSIAGGSLGKGPVGERARFPLPEQIARHLQNLRDPRAVGDIYYPGLGLANLRKMGMGQEVLQRAATDQRAYVAELTREAETVTEMAKTLARILEPGR